MNSNPALPLIIIGVFAAAMLILGFILSRKKESGKRDSKVLGYVLFAIIVVVIVALARSAPSAPPQPNVPPKAK
jgi:hypothetical protein